MRRTGRSLGNQSTDCGGDPSRRGDAADDEVLDDTTTLEGEAPEAAEESVLPIAPLPDQQAKLPLTPELIALKQRVQGVLKYYYPHHLSARDNDPWQVMHGIIAYGVNAQLFRSGSSGPTVNAISWMCYNGTLRGEQLLYLDHGQIVARKGPGLQGHYGQLLAILRSRM